MSNKLKAFACLVFLVGIAALAGCGGGSKVADTSAKDAEMDKSIREIQSTLDKAASMEALQDWATAKTMYQVAKSKADDILTKGDPSGADASNLRDKTSVAAGRIDFCDKKLEEIKAAQQAATKSAAASKAPKIDPKTGKPDPKAVVTKDVNLTPEQQAEKKKKEQDEINKKNAALVGDVKPVKPNKPEGGGDDEDKTAGGGTTKGGDPKKPAGDAPPPEPKGPYSKVKPDGPPVVVDKVQIKSGEFALVYFQVVNKAADKAYRIGRWTVVLQDDGNGKISEADAVFEFAKFNPDAKDLLDQADGKAAVTGGSHEVGANGVLQLVAVYQDKQRAARVRKAKITIEFEDGPSVNGNGPDGNAAVADPAQGGGIFKK